MRQVKARTPRIRRIQARMRQLQTAADDTGLGRVSPVECQRFPADDEDDGRGLNRGSRRSAFAALVFDLPSGSFAFVMATGTVSIAAMRLGRGEIAAALFAVNLVAFPLLRVLMLIRMFRRPATILSELRNHRIGASFLATVAAASILGSQFV